MGCHDSGSDAPISSSSALTIAIGGNPNCGKSALFNTLTGIRQKTGNWPGVTVDRKEGRCKMDGHDVSVIDLPGIYSMDATSIDEEISRDFLLSREFDLIINVVDAANLERNLYFTVQLLEMGVPMVLALNMMDIARKRGIKIDIARLSQELGCPVVPIVATTEEGLSELQARVLAVASKAESGGFGLAHDEIIEQAMLEIEGLMPSIEKANRRWLALKLLENDDKATSLTTPEAHECASKWQQQIAKRSGEETDILIAGTRFTHAHGLTQTVLKERGKVGKTISDRIDSLVLNRWLGVPVFLAILYLMFTFTINIGGAFIDFFDLAAGAIFVDGVGELLSVVGMPDWVSLLIADGMGSGIQTVATFIPIIGALYLFLSFLEDSGYMARAAFVMDRFMRSIGLPGKAFVPLIVGFGCNVPAIMATRTLENQRERKLTILMNPFMSCGARLPVYALFAAAFFPENGQNLVFALYLIGIVVAILTGLIMKQTLLGGESTGFMMELPPYHLPTIKGILLRTWDRVRVFVKEAGQIIIMMVMALTLLNSIGTDGSLSRDNSENSILSVGSKYMVPAFTPMGIREENWPAVVGIFSGLLAKEVVVGTLDSLYTQLALASNPEAESEEPFDLISSLSDAAATIPENLSGVIEMFTDPLGLNIVDTSNQAEAAKVQEVNANTFGEMVARFDGQAGAFAYLLFVLLYFPCAAVIGAVKREAGMSWAMFVAFWTTFVAYTTASSYYQIATWAQHPTSSMIWIGSMVASYTIVIVVLRAWARREETGLSETAEAST